MEIYGYQKSGDDLLELKEMSLLCTIEELGKVIDFLEEVKKTHTMVRDKTDICHSHYRDWNLQWKKGEPDIIIVTQNNLER